MLLQVWHCEERFPQRVPHLFVPGAPGHAHQHPVMCEQAEKMITDSIYLVLLQRVCAWQRVANGDGAARVSFGQACERWQIACVAVPRHLRKRSAVAVSGAFCVNWRSFFYPGIQGACSLARGMAVCFCVRRWFAKTCSVSLARSGIVWAE